ncbi:MAG: hypothetical protein GWN76_11710, partial [candidate division Zixibacteria bacterium]|nr:hypothetical protein [candidate division Zixibacteria bacterium]NIW47965.1 hypothetical protein [Gammaproteobacteria bacterium]NIX02525.1 hypothetical protein [Phycisphaerae bacterium]NIR64688.1 hypothetical protein [candidate division Zixibacteria bacterium]NIS46532.1 hypothetical protein [candidate division Zixibacteria bacterium]
FGAITLEAGGLTLDASAAPTVTFNDSDAAGAAAADEEAVKILANMSTTTEDAEVSDVAMTFMDAGTRESFLRFDGSAWQLFLGPQTDGWSGGDVTGYEQLTFDFDTANDGEIAITSTSSSTLNNQLDTYFGVDDNEPGVVAVYGGGTGEEGGELYLYTGADDDTSIANYSALVVEDDLLIGSDGDTDMLKFIAETSIQSTVAFDVDGAFTAGTLDADTDFTVDGLVISADSIENDATL